MCTRRYGDTECGRGLLRCARNDIKKGRRRPCVSSCGVGGVFSGFLQNDVLFSRRQMLDSQQPWTVMKIHEA